MSCMRVDDFALFGEPLSLSSLSLRECRDTEKTPCVGDVDSAILLKTVLEYERPDLVVFSGDQVGLLFSLLPAPPWSRCKLTRRVWIAERAGYKLGLDDRACQVNPVVCLPLRRVYLY